MVSKVEVQQDSSGRDQGQGPVLKGSCWVRKGDRSTYETSHRSFSQLSCFSGLNHPIFAPYQSWPWTHAAKSRAGEGRMLPSFLVPSALWQFLAFSIGVTVEIEQIDTGQPLFWWMRSCSFLWVMEGDIIWLMFLPVWKSCCQNGLCLAVRIYWGWPTLICAKATFLLTGSFKRNILLLLPSLGLAY